MAIQRWPKPPVQKEIPKNLTGQPYESLFREEKLEEIRKLHEKLKVAKTKHLLQPKERDHVYEILHLNDLIHEKNQELRQVAYYSK